MKVKVKIESVHGDDEPIAAVYDGVREDTQIRYGDGDVLTIGSDEIVIDETGQMKAHIVLRPDGHVRMTPFETAMGTLVFGIETRHVRIVRIPGKTVIETAYDLLAEGEIVNKVEMFITVVDCE